MADTPPEHADPAARTPGATAAHRGVRRQKAVETRWRIMDAALAEFTERGYHDTTMAAIAERAGVAVQTVYLGFRTKSGLLEDLVGNAVLGRTRDGEIGPPDETEEWARALSEPDGIKALALLVETAFLFTNARRRSATRDDRRTRPIRTWPNGGCGARRSGSTDACRWCRPSPTTAGFEPDLSVEEAADVLATTLSPQSFLAFTVDRGWTVDHLGAWLKDALRGCSGLACR